MSLFDDFGDSGDSGGIANAWDTALGFGQEYTQGRGAETVSTSALQSMQPVNSGASSTGWGSFFQNTVSSVLGYAAAKNATGATAPTPVQPLPLQQSPQMGSILMLAVIGGGIFLAVKAAGK